MGFYKMGRGRLAFTLLLSHFSCLIDGIWTAEELGPGGRVAPVVTDAI